MALKNLWARKSRTMLVVLGVVVCVVLINTVDGMLSAMKSDLERDMARHEGRMYLRQPGSGYPPFGSNVAESVIQEALAHPDIDLNESTALLLLVIVPADNPMDDADVAGIGIMPGKEAAYTDYTPAAAGVNTLQGTPEDSVILGADAANYYGTSVGQQLDVNGEWATVVGILARRKVDNIDRAVLMHLSFAQRIFGKEGVVSAALLKPKEPGHSETLASDLSARFPKLEIATEANIKQEASKALEMPNQFMGMISWAVFAAAILMVTNMMLVAVRERTREIGTLTALGMRPRTVMLTILYEALVLTTAGGVIGIALTVPAAYLGGWTWILSYGEVAKVSILILLAGGLAALYPAYRATRISPVEALRYE
ncbi:ABC transporter permease [Chloroflexota bacterium]